MEELDPAVRVELAKWQKTKDETMKNEILEQLREKYEKDVVVVCTDMSGFSRVTKEEGILFFLANVKVMQGLCVPIMHSRGGKLVKVVADNLFVIFSDPTQAAQAAADCIDATAAYSHGKRRNEQIKYVCVFIVLGVWM